MLCLDKQVMSLALCSSQTRKIKLITEQTMVGVLSNEGIDVQKKEGNPQPYLASMESVHQDNIWTCEPRTDHIFHRPFVMARVLDAGSGDAFTGRTSELRGKDIDPQPNRVGFNQDYPKTTPQQCPVAFKCVTNISVKTTPQQCPVAFKCVYNKSGLLSNELMKVCEKEGNYSPTLSPSDELQNEKAIITNGNILARFSATNDVQAKDGRHLGRYTSRRSRVSAAVKAAMLLQRDCALAAMGRR